jgi:hypothetical protein
MVSISVDVSAAVARRIRDLAYADRQVRGMATDVGVEAAPFAIDAETGDAAGGFQGWLAVGS